MDRQIGLLLAKMQYGYQTPNLRGLKAAVAVLHLHATSRFDEFSVNKNQ
jgi:hypothetical protein